MGKKGGAPSGSRAVSPGESDLWRKAMEDATPYGDKEAPANSAPATAKASRAPRPVPPGPPSAARLPDLRPGVVAGVDKRTAARLRRGQLAIEARIDLHGLTQEEAHRALNAFLAGSQAADRRCVLVITGKGLRPDGTIGVLREAVPRWLNEAPNRARVLAVTRATPRDGGDGALYVLLKRRK
jgi:DNA-nicking Smr family endonuclease